MPQQELRCLRVYSAQLVPEIGVCLVGNGPGRIFADLLCVNHHIAGCRKGYDHPHSQTEACAGKDGNSRDTLGYGHREGAHPGYGISHLGSHIGYGYRDNGIITQSDHKRYHDHGEGDTLLCHTEGGSAQ